MTPTYVGLVMTMLTALAVVGLFFWFLHFLSRFIDGVLNTTVFMNNVPFPSMLIDAGYFAFYVTTILFADYVKYLYVG